jgi:type IV pilus assembly protein PilC
MPTFNATYTTSGGQSRRVRIQASDLNTARRNLRQRGIVPSTLQQVSAQAVAGAIGKSSASGILSFDLNRLFEARPGVREKALFANKMAALVDAGVPIVRSLSLMAEQQKMPMFKRALTAVTTDVTQGEALGTSMRRWPKVFDRLTIAMVEAGEVGGVLDETLRRLSILLEATARLQNQIKGAMGYPIAVLVVAVAVFLGMTIFIIPIFAGIFQSLGAELPAFTQALVDISKFLRSPYSLLIVVALVIVGLVFARYYSTKSGRLRIDGIILKLPLFGELIQKTATAQFCRTFSSLSKAGVPILLALEITQDTAGNAVISKAVGDSRSNVQEGVPLSMALSSKNVFPDLAMSMLNIGEETGGMDAMLSKVADFYEDEVETMVKLLTSMLEPAMIVLVGGMVGAMLVAMYLPMFTVYDKIK